MRVYATDDNGERFLRHMACDVAGCSAVLPPGPNVGESGWVQCGAVLRDGSRKGCDLCPDHAHKAPDWERAVQEEDERTMRARGDFAWAGTWAEAERAEAAAYNRRYAGDGGEEQGT